MSPEHGPPLRAVLFDLDGTLLDTAPDMVGALNLLLAERGAPSQPYAAARALVSHGAGSLVKLGFPQADTATFTLLVSRYLELYSGVVSRETRPFAGMDVVLAELTRRGLLYGVVTNKPGWLTVPLLEQQGLAASMACIVSGDTVAERKPHPLPMLHAAALAGVEPAHCVYLGDARRDIEAAHAAGMEALVATYGYLEADEDWRAWGGDAELHEPLELLRWLDRRQAA